MRFSSPGLWNRFITGCSSALIVNIENDSSGRPLLRQPVKGFGKLLEERLAQYKAKTEARIPLDFTEELVPAETLAHNKVALDGKFAVKEKEDAEAPFADDEGHFRKKKQRIRKFEHITEIDEMDCGAASLGMICRHFGRKVSLARIRQRFRQLPQPAAPQGEAVPPLRQTSEMYGVLPADHERDPGARKAFSDRPNRGDVQK